MSNLTFKQYRTVDLITFSAILALSEIIATVATKKWFNLQSIAISTTLLFVCIIMMRWSGFAAIPACFGGLVFCIASRANLQQYVIYIVGNCAALLSMLWFKVFKKEGVRKDPLKLILFVITAYLSLQLGRWGVSLCFGAGLKELIGFLTSDVISLLFTAIVMVLMRGVEGMIEDQKAYLFRLERERKEEQQQFFSGNDGYGSGE